jgi:hypothetical protein
VDGKALLLVGGAVALPWALENGTALGKKAGKANDAAAGVLGNVAGIAFEVPANHSMVAAFESMRTAIARASSPPKATQVRTLWLAALDAGAKADVVNYTLLRVSTGNGIIDTGGSTADLAVCGMFSGDDLTELGAAVCALETLSVSPFGHDADDLQAVLAATARMAAAMDAADFTRDGGRRSDGIHITSLNEIPAKLVGALAGVVGDAATAFLTSPVGFALVGGAAYLAWRHFK